jgi:hypothetical protein
MYSYFNTICSPLIKESLHEKFFSEKHITLLQFKQAIAAKTIIVSLFNESTLLGGERHAKTLAMHHVTGFTFKALPATRAAFFFMLTHAQVYWAVCNTVNFVFAHSNKPKKMPL